MSIFSRTTWLTASGLAFVDEIPAAQFVWRESDGFGDAVEMALQRKNALRSAEAAKRAVRRSVCGDGAAANAHVRAIVGTGGVDGAARKHDRRKSRVGAAVDREIDVHGEKFAVAR